MDLPKVVEWDSSSSSEGSGAALRARRRIIAFGSNTSFVEVSCGGTRMIFDAGTGIRNLGHWLVRKNVNHATIFLSHVHWDHINGFPFFSPAFRHDCSFTIMARHLSKFGGVRNVLAGPLPALFAA